MLKQNTGPALLALLVLLVYLSPAPLLGQTPGAAKRTPLDVDARLGASITLAVRYRPLEELLASVQRETGVALAARAGGPWEVRDLRASLFFEKRPAAEVLGLLARHLGLRWYRKANGFELAGDPANDEAARRQGDLEAQLAAIEQRMKGLASLAGRSNEQLEARQREIDIRLGGQVAAEERASLRDEKAAIGDLLRPEGRPCVRLYQRLTPDQRRQLLETGDLYLSARDGSLTGQEVAQLHAARLETRRRVVQPADLATFPEPESPTDGDLRIRLTTERLPWLQPRRRGERRLTLAFEAALAADRSTGLSSWCPRIEGAPPEPRTTVPEDPALLRPVALPMALLKEAGGLRSYTIGPARFAKTELLLPLGGFADVLHRVTGLQVVADGFVRARLDATKVATPEGHPRPLVEILDAAVEGLDYAWHKEGDVLFFRSRTDCYDRPAEVPERIFRPWLQNLTRRGEPKMEELEDLERAVELALALTDEQCRSLSEFWERYAEDTVMENRGVGGLVYGERHDLRLWASLSAAQKRALISGNALPVAEMNPRQQTAFATALAAPLGDLDGVDAWVHAVMSRPRQMLRPEWTTQEMAGAAFRLRVMENRPKSEPGRQVHEGGAVSYTPRYVLDFQYMLASPRFQVEGREWPARSRRIYWG